MIKKVLRISKFKRQFKQSPDKFFTSRKAFVTFKSHVDVWDFQRLYKRAYKFRLSEIFRKKSALELRKKDLPGSEVNLPDDSLEEFSALIRLEEKPVQGGALREARASPETELCARGSPPGTLRLLH